jgi:hypothetical protein
MKNMHVYPSKHFKSFNFPPKHSSAVAFWHIFDSSSLFSCNKSLLPTKDTIEK